MNDQIVKDQEKRTGNIRSKKKMKAKKITKKKNARTKQHLTSWNTETNEPKSELQYEIDMT